MARLSRQHRPEQIDYRLTDRWADPPGLTDGGGSERLWRLSGHFLCYEPPASAPAPVMANGHVTFGSFNNLAKLSPRTIATWARLLEEVPRSRLVIKARGVDEGVARRLVGAFGQHGVAPDRLDVRARVDDFEGHLAAYGWIDIALDTFPYNGATTTCEALWQGVPVVTLAGNRHCHRVGASLLTAAGLGDLIADSGRLATLRAGMRGRPATSPLCDQAGLVLQAPWRTRTGRRGAAIAPAASPAANEKGSGEPLPFAKRLSN